MRPSNAFRPSTTHPVALARLAGSHVSCLQSHQRRVNKQQPPTIVNAGHVEMNSNPWTALLNDAYKSSAAPDYE